MNKIDIDNNKKELNISSSKKICIYDEIDATRIYNVDNNSILQVYHYNFNCNSKVIINLNGDSSEVEYHFSTINYSDNNYNIVVNHNNKNTISNIYNHGVNVFNKKLHFDICGTVLKNMDNCICNQENQIINLSDGNSTILPKLLIDNYNISSQHSAYIGKFKDDVLFYLMSRGIKKDTAIKLLVSSLLINNGNSSEELSKFREKIENI